MRTRWGHGALVLVILGGLLAATPARAGAPAVAFGDAGGLHVVASTQLDPRQFDVTVDTAALGRPVHVRILVPSDYGDTTDRLPVLYLFHGTSGRASDWITNGDAEAATDGLPLIVVMPDAGFDGDGGGWFTNWFDTATALGPSQWETFHIDQLVPWVDTNLRTIAARGGRAIAGLSQGGFGSTTYAARHPDLFASVASFSGAPDIDYDPVIAAGATVIIDGTAFGLDGVEPDAMFGSRATNEINWQGHDPADLAENLRAVDVWLYTASGEPGPLDPPQANLGSSAIEGATHQSTYGFVRRAQSLGVPFHLVDYGAGTHTWPYWARDLRDYLPHAMAAFAAAPLDAPAYYQSVEPEWSQWDWSVVMHRQAAQAFTTLSGATCDGFTLQGSGRATVTTPPCYLPGFALEVTIGGVGRERLVAGADGRLRIDVPLGLDLAVPAVVGVPVQLGTPVSVTVTAT